MTESKPLVTVGIATYNGSEHLKSALRSVLSSNYPNIELLILDDGSTDDSIAIAERANDPRIRIISKKTNSGLVSTRKQLMKEARGTYLAWLDQDDIMFPHRIASQVTFLERNHQVGACGSWTIRRVHELSGKVVLRKSPCPEGSKEIRASMPFVNPIWFNTATMRVSAFTRNNLMFREEYGNTLDYDMWSRAADVMELRNVPEYLGEYRVHPSQTSQSPAAERMLDASWRVQCNVLHRNLGVDVDASADHIHRRITLTRDLLLSESDVIEAGIWLRLLLDRNRTLEAYDEIAFCNAIGRQWMVCLLNLSRVVGVSRALKLAAESHSVIGIPAHKLMSYGFSWIARGQGSVIVRKLTHPL